MNVHLAPFETADLPLALFGSGDVDPSLIAETVLWIFALIVFIILGLTILIKLRREEKNARLGIFDAKGGIDRFEDLYKKRLITYDEYQTIQKNLANRLVYDVFHQETDPGKKKKEEKWGKDSGLDDKEKRLKSLLEGMEKGESSL